MVGRFAVPVEWGQVNLLESYLREMRGIRGSGSAVAEASYYTALANLLNRAGAGLRPRVRCVINVRNQGAGIPDGDCSHWTGAATRWRPGGRQTAA